MAPLSSFTEEAASLDSQHPCNSTLFTFPTFESMGLPIDEEKKKSSSSKVNYLCGNSLGLMPASTPQAINNELKAWADRAVESHFRHRGEPEGLTPWLNIDLPVVPLLAPIVGAKDTEVACMGTLTMNLNSLMCSFYKPTKTRYKILFEKGAFPSDYYAFLNQAKLHGFDEDALIQVETRPDEYSLRTEDIIDVLQKNADSIAIVCFPGIQYYSGQLFDIETITKIGHEIGAVVGWDLAHAVGNVDLKLHDWNVDFAAWCSYKYLNSGPGGIGGIFVHEKHTKISNDGSDWKPRLAGWWGNDANERFKMLEEFKPIESALAFRQSNPSVLDVVSLKSSLEIFEQCGGLPKLRPRAIMLTSFLEKLLKSSKYYKSLEESKTTTTPHFIILTPEIESQRGSQLSVMFKPHYESKEENIMERISSYLNQHGTICDERRPDVVRLAPTALYNTFSDCLECVILLEEAFEKL
ncbi:hypothetical protein CANARDRAFT_199271 [[Candida] arabinofermentans NRRL YB-2248]|uniref:Kynureninase n=1 Tax=[Candida] arabinofermentans NRRL YB-2248 TaxID=983967 RepID=A0A1E4T0B5_9ASCO|nr:hypothetical protein CANARDRAFT_199271 [[Candida] arabinofermentans NRRL YB-2248]